MIDFSTYTDQQLVLLLNEESAGAYTEIYNRYKVLLYQHAYKKLHSQEETDDIIHELFATLWMKRTTLKVNESLSGYLYTSVRNRILDFISSQKVRANYVTHLQSFIEKNEIVTDYNVRVSLFKQVIDQEIARLPQKMRDIFEMSRRDQLSNQEIAEKLGLSEKTVKNQINNSLKILRKRLGVLIYLNFSIIF